MSRSTYIRSKTGAGVVNSDISAYNDAVLKRKQDKYIKGLEQRITKLESALSLLENTVKEMTK
ncbi:SlyX family protein [bacterium]|nr:SlyX family protein [bacterium]